jgi:hypothetical protein
MESVLNKRGGYRFLPAIDPYSSGVVAADGYQIEHVTLRRPVPFEQGLHLIDEELGRRGRSRQALCNVQLRSPAPFSFDGFADFNAAYHRFLVEWNLLIDGVNPLARTNVAPEVGAPPRPALFGFSFTSPLEGPQRSPTFAVAGAGEVIDGRLDPEAVVRRGDVSIEGLLEKADFVIGEMAHRLDALGVASDLAMRVNVYTVHPITTILPELMAGRLAGVPLHGVHLYYSRPPVKEIEFEMDMRGTQVEWTV